MLKYEEIALDLQNKILSGEYKLNEQLPLEKELCDKYGVSRITIKKAVDELVMGGLVVKRRGSGTFVKDVEHSQMSEVTTSRQFTGFSAMLKGKKVVSKIVEFAVVNPPEDIAKKLQMSTDSFVYYICRARYGDGEPYVMEYTYMPIEIITGIKRDILEKSIYNYIENELKLKIKSAHRTLRASLPTELEKEYLEVTEQIPILEVEGVAFLADGRPFEYSKARHRSDKFEFKSVSVR